jgi:hypothetical protein
VIRNRQSEGTAEVFSLDVVAPAAVNGLMGRCMQLFIRIVLLCAVLIASALPLAAEDAGTVITIDSAQKSEYKKDKDTGNDVIILTGTVSISVTSGSTKTVITADSVTYDRKTNMLYATGSVTLKQTGSGSSGGEDITADSLLFNTDTLEGVFDNGRVVQTQSDAINLPSGSTLIVSSSMFGRDSSSTIAFKDGVLTFCDNKNPHWKIRASRIWLLPGGEFAFVNAVLFVGHIPVLYFPAFYYPKDELIFNPAFGYNKRTGYYVQTTTYLFGRKPLDTSTSTTTSSSSDDDTSISEGLFSFMKSSKLKDQVQEGLVLHNLDTDYTGNSTNYFKIMGDYYSNLGGLVGFEGVVKPSDYITDIEANVKVGFSNTIFYTNDIYLPYSPSGLIYQDKSNFMGLKLPFRYSANAKLTISKPFSLTLALPLYSDPYFTYDFGTRAESMDWIGFLMSSAEGTTDDTDTTTSEVSSFTWAINGSYSQSLPDFCKPFVSTLSISSFSSSIIFSSKANTEISADVTDNWYKYTPERKFYYPSQIVPFKISGKLAGTIIQIPFATTVKKTTSDQKFPLELTAPADLKEASEDADKAASTQTSDDESASNEPQGALDETALPELDVASATTVTTFNGINYLLDYSVAPEYTSQITYDSSNLATPADFKWNVLQSSYYQIKVPTTLSSSFGYRDTFFTLKNVFTFSPVYQKHPNLDGYTKTAAATLVKTDYTARKMDLTETNAVSFRPFLYTSYFKNTGLDWNTTVKMIRTEFIGDEDNPEWEYLTMDLKDDECVTVHTLSANIAAVEGDYSQTLTLSTTLPPQTDKYNGTLAFVFPYLSLNFASGFEKTTTTSTGTTDTVDTWSKLPFQQSASVSLFSKTLTLTQSFNYNLEDNYSDSLKFALSWQGVQLAYTMQYTYGYDFDSDDGWVVRTDKEFLPLNVSMAYTTPSKTFRYWKNRITWAPTLNTSIVYDCLRPTNSYFKFIPSISFKINNFLELTFSSESRNSVIFRYMQKYVNFEGEIPGETNPIIDLWNSFAFWDESLRKASGFKLKNLTVKITHSLCDWDLNTSFTVKPRLITDNGIKSYDFSPYFTIAVVWKPLSSMKTEVVDDYGTWELNP